MALACHVGRPRQVEKLGSGRTGASGRERLQRAAVGPDLAQRGERALVGPPPPPAPVQRCAFDRPAAATRVGGPPRPVPPPPRAAIPSPGAQPPPGASGAACLSGLAGAGESDWPMERGCGLFKAAPAGALNIWPERARVWPVLRAIADRFAAVECLVSSRQVHVGRQQIDARKTKLR